MIKKRALISVSDKNGIVEFAKEIQKLGWEIISTGGTKKVLDENGLKTVSIDEVTGFPEMLDGRVKTLHPIIHGGLLSLRDNPDHVSQVEKHNIEYIDMVVVNLYPFKETIMKDGVTMDEAIENIDIGGPSMLRSAAKNFRSVTVIVDNSDFSKVLEELKANDETTFETRQRLATKVFNHTAYYDSYIANYLNEQINDEFPQKLTIAFEKKEELRYGENPHQKASFYVDSNSHLSLSNATQIQGKKLSYNNIQDSNAAIQIMSEFSEAVVVGLKHMNPCGVGTGSNVKEAWVNCYEGDSTSIFGGIVSTNQEVDLDTAKLMNNIFLEIIIAPSFSKEALEEFSKKKNLRLLKLEKDNAKQSKWQYTSVNGGLLRQEIDSKNVDDCELEYVTDKRPSKEELEDLIMAQKIVKHVKSNAIVVVKNKKLIGVGAGQMNRVGASKIALEWCKDKSEGAVMASDAFFPFPDCVDLASEYKISSIIQPGGSINDKLSIENANKAGISMVMTKMRHFKH